MSVNRVFMSFIGLPEVCQNEQCLFIDDRPFQKIASSFKLRLLAEKVTCNFSIQSVLSNFPIESILSQSFRQRACCPILFGKDCAARILSRKERAVAFGNSWRRSLKTGSSSPKKLEISSLIGGLLRFLFAFGLIRNGFGWREYATRFILVIP